MNRNQDKVLSASRRTDIPAFYIEWFLSQVDQGSFEVVNPYNRVSRTIPVSPLTIHTIVFWSKNFGPFIETKAGEYLEKKGYQLYFNFTVNSESELLEPNIPPLEDRFEQVTALCRSFGPDKVAWRFDPICFYQVGRGPIENNLSQFSEIADFMGTMKITKCVTSFTDIYSKIHKRLHMMQITGLRVPSLVDPDLNQKKELVLNMEKDLNTHGIHLFLCCENHLYSSLVSGSQIKENACIDGQRLKEIYQGNPVVTRDYGQRKTKGCRCTRSIDIGSYDHHPCFHDCLFCYANPSIDKNTRQKK